MPPKLIHAIIHAESRFNPNAVSPKGARGLMQLMPVTASRLGVREPFDPRQNIDGGVRHLRALMERFANDWPLVIAAYNAGEGAIALHRGIPPYPGIREYVTQVLRLFMNSGEGVSEDAAAVQTTSSEAVPLLSGSFYRIRQADGGTLYTNIPPFRSR